MSERTHQLAEERIERGIDVVKESRDEREIELVSQSLDLCFASGSTFIKASERKHRVEDVDNGVDDLGRFLRDLFVGRKLSLAEGRAAEFGRRGEAEELTGRRADSAGELIEQGLELDFKVGVDLDVESENGCIGAQAGTEKGSERSAPSILATMARQISMLRSRTPSTATRMSAATATSRLAI